MRIAYKNILHKEGTDVRTSIDASPEEISEGMAYGQKEGYSSRDDFFRTYLLDRDLETIKVLEGLLDKKRRILSIGSGRAQHEVVLGENGYDIVASDVLMGQLESTKKLFPSLKITQLDIFDPPKVSYEDVLSIGDLLFYFDDDKAALILKNIAGLLEDRGGRFIYCHSFNDNLLTWTIDNIICPVEAMIVNKRKRGGMVCSRKRHGYRRGRKEIIALAKNCGFKPGRVRYGGFGVELRRSFQVDKLFRMSPFLYGAARNIDRLVKAAHNLIVFEFKI